MTAVGVIAGWEVRGAARSRWALGLALLYTAAAVTVTLVNLRSMSVLGLRGVGAVVDGLIAVGVLIPPLFGILVAAGSLSGARETGMLALVASQPLQRSAISMGSFVGLTLTVWAAVGVGLGVVAVILAPVVSVGDLGALAVAVAATLAAGAIGVALGLVVSVLVSGRGQAVAAATAIWFLTALGIDAILVALAPVALGPQVLLAFSLLNPLTAIRMLAMVVVDPSSLGPFGVFLEDRVGHPQTLAMFGATVVAWIMIPVMVASSILRHRDI